MEWEPGMKVRCVRSYGCFNVGDVFELTRLDYGTMWNTNPVAPLFIAQERLKTNWEVVDMEFTKDDLKVGMLVEVKNGYLYVLMETHNCRKVLVNKNGKENFNLYDNCLIHDYNSSWDIVKVYGLPYHFSTFGNNIYTTEDRKLLWERKEEVVKELTMEQLEKDYGCKVKIVKE